MTVDIAQTGRYVFYLNFRTEGDGSNFAETEQNFTFSNLIEDSSNYVVTVERFRVPLQTIPMYQEDEKAIFLSDTPAGAPLIPLQIDDSFSLLNFLNQMNDYQPGALILSLTDDGRVRLQFTDFTNYDNITLSERLSKVLGLPENIPVPGAPIIVFGTAPLFDQFDQLYKIQIEAQTGLGGMQQEIVTTAVFRNLLTDFLVPSSTTMSFFMREGDRTPRDFTINTNVREDLEFNNATNRRYIMLKGNAPIQNIRLEIVAIYRDGTRHQIIMPSNGILEVKLAFWKKT